MAAVKGKSQRMGQACALSIAALPGGAGSLAGLAGARILASGATGFFGQWVHAALAEVRASGIGVRLSRLERDPGGFARRCPLWGAQPWTDSVHAEAKSFGASEVGAFDFGLHMATSSDAACNAANPSDMMLSTLAGTSGMLDWCQKAGARMLLVGSGAVYGKREPRDGPASESMAAKSAPDPLDPKQCYGEAKRGAEMLCAVRSSSVESCMVRPFAFLGPHLPLSTHFAAGNFLRDASRGEAIVIKGDGTPVRSYMHPADLAAWLLWLMVHGPSGKAVNIGSDRAMSLADLSGLIARTAGSPAPQVLGSKGAAADYYVPDLTRAKSLGLCAAHDLESSVESSLDWLRASVVRDWDAMPD